MAKIKTIKKKLQESEEFNDLTRTSLKDIFDGNVFSKSYFLKQIKLIVLVSFYIFFYMDNRMECEKQIATVNDLNQQLTDVKYTSMVIEANLLSISRRTQIEALLNQQSIELKELSIPPYKLKAQ
jgi:hypothetical protein